MSRRRRAMPGCSQARAAAAAIVATLGLLSGCALLRPPPKDGAAPPPPAVLLEVQAPGPLEPLLANNLDLGRLRSVASAEPIGDVELKRLELATPAQARALLETEGYFAPSVDLERLDGNPPRVRVRVEPGPRAHVERVDLAVIGPLAEAAETQDAGASAARAAFLRSWPLKAGDVFRNAAWQDAKTATLARLRAEGYAAAGWRDTSAVVDAKTLQVTLAGTVDSGPLYRTGALRIEGLALQSDVTVRNLADFPPGTPASEALLLDYQDRLLKSGLFDRVSVTLETDPAQAAAAPIDVRVHEQRLEQATIGVGVSANTGPRVSLDHSNRRLFGQRLTLRNKFEVGRDRQAWDGELSTQAQAGLHRNLLGISYERLIADDEVTSLRTRIGRSKESLRIDRFSFVQALRAIVDNNVRNERADSLSLDYNATFRDVDSVLLPTTGQGLSIETAGGWARSNVAPAGPYLRAYGKLQVWRPFGRWYGLARIEVGQVLVNNGVLVPEPERFRAGGDESVRGYDYRSLGPLRSGVVESGNVLFTSSVELAHPISPKLPAVWGAVFIDAGSAANHWGSLSPAVGAGFGVRWRSPVGPLKVDLAYGERTAAWRLHLSVGVAF